MRVSRTPRCSLPILNYNYKIDIGFRIFTGILEEICFGIEIFGMFGNLFGMFGNSKLIICVEYIYN